MKVYDVAIIGGGVVGLATARELTRTGASVLLIEKEHDIARGASGRNSGVVHPGFSVKPGSLKARLNVDGSRRLRTICTELGIPLRETGTVVVAATDDEIATLESMEAAGLANGLKRIGIVDGARLGELDPTVSGVAALHSADGAIIEPHILSYRLSESAADGGCEFLMESWVTALVREGGRWLVSAGAETVSARVVVNSAGLGAPMISDLAGAEHYDSFPCRGEYLILDREARGVPSMMVYPVPPKSGGLGVHFTPTIAGNTLIGPSAEFVDGGEDYATTGSVLEQLFSEASVLCPTIDRADIIATMAGVRAKIAKGAYGLANFVVAPSALAEDFINLVGIESPGLSASPAIAREVLGFVCDMLPTTVARIAAVPAPRVERFRDLDDEARAARAEAVEGDRHVVCRCETVTRAEVAEALANPVGAKSLSAVKTRCRAGSGRCGGSFCGPKVLAMIEETGVPIESITLKGVGSEVVLGEAGVLWAEAEATMADRSKGDAS
jgi:glycerol-3-phosphate dehydrogenase